MLFDATVLGGMRLANRLVRSATWEALATPDGASTPRLAEFMGRLAEGGVGLAITGHAYVSREGQAGPWQLGLHDDALLPALRELAGAAHRHGTPVVAQLAHAGAQASTRLSGLEAVGPSEATRKRAPPCRELTLDGLARVVRAFGEAAARARRAGFDGVQVHAAHGYLLSQFLSPFSNRRGDAYGGSLANRSRLLVEVVRAARAAAGPDFPVLVKLNSEDFVEGGFTVEDMLAVSSLLEAEGVAAIELSGGTIHEASRYPTVRPGAIAHEEEGYYRAAARRFKAQVRTPLVLVGGIRSPDVAERLVADGTTDYVALCRPLICEPDLPRRWRSGSTERSACLSDNRCFRPAIAGEGLRCLLERR